MPPPVIIVMLRQPNRRDPSETRTDPLWEFGSFGCTRCHTKNLMNRKRIEEVHGARLAFVQGGPQGLRLVMLTPPVKTVVHKDCCEVKWPAGEMPLRYSAAPIVVDRSGRSNFARLRTSIARVNRSTWVARFSSAFRSRRTPLRGGLARELVRNWNAAIRVAGPIARCQHYADALPYPPPKIDSDRAATYEQLLRRADGTTSDRYQLDCRSSSCATRPNRRCS